MKRSRLREVCAAVFVLTACALLVFGAGCGPSTDTSDLAPIADASRRNPPASGVAITEELTIDQIAFESPIRRTTDRNGLKFLQFSYGDKDGKVYKCHLPEGMATGKRKPDQWLAVFQVYRQEGQATVRSTVTARPQQNLGDFPFISPKPHQEQPASTSAPTAAPTPQPAMPALQPLPSSSGPTNAPPPGTVSGPGPGPMPPAAP